MYPNYYEPNLYEDYLLEEMQNACFDDWKYYEMLGDKEKAQGYELSYEHIKWARENLRNRRPYEQKPYHTGSPCRETSGQAEVSTETKPRVYIRER